MIWPTNGATLRKQGVRHLIVWPTPYDSAVSGTRDRGACGRTVTGQAHERTPQRRRAGQRRLAWRIGIGRSRGGLTGRQRCLLHGVLQTGAGMAHLAEQLSLDREVLVPDLRGRGDSDQPEDGYDPPTMADDVAGLIDRSGSSGRSLIGRLHGGLVAYHLAARRPGAGERSRAGRCQPGGVRGSGAQASSPRSTRCRGRLLRVRTRCASTRRGCGSLPTGHGTTCRAISSRMARRLIVGDMTSISSPASRGRRLPRSDWDVLAQRALPGVDPARSARADPGRDRGAHAADDAGRPRADHLRIALTTCSSDRDRSRRWPRSSSFSLGWTPMRGEFRPTFAPAHRIHQAHSPRTQLPLSHCASNAHTSPCSIPMHETELQIPEQQRSSRQTLQQIVVTIGDAAIAGERVPHHRKLRAGETHGKAFPAACFAAGGGVSASALPAFLAGAALLLAFPVALLRLGRERVESCQGVGEATAQDGATRSGRDDASHQTTQPFSVHGMLQRDREWTAAIRRDYKPRACRRPTRAGRVSAPAAIERELPSRMR